MNHDLKIVHCKINDLPPKYVILDIDPEDASQKIGSAVKGTRTILVNGTAGLFENKRFSGGTEAAVLALAAHKRLNPETKILGFGGNGVAAIVEIFQGREKAEKFFQLSTMGGAALEYLAGENFPGERLPALKYVELKGPPARKKNLIDYSRLKTISDMPDKYWLRKTVYFIADLNVGKTSNGVRLSEMDKIEGIINSLVYLLWRGVKKIRIIAHNGRKKDYKLPADAPDGAVDKNYSLEPVAEIITRLLRERNILYDGEKVEFVPDCLALYPGGSRIELRENTRFYGGETSDDPAISLEFVQRLCRANRSDIAVNDAAGALHRDDGSKGPATILLGGPRVVGLLVRDELEKLFAAVSNPQKPLLAIFQGEKTDDKIPAIKSFITERVADRIAIMGKIAVPFIKNGDGTSEILKLAEENAVEIILPEKAVAAKIPGDLPEEKFIKALKNNQI